MIKSKQHKGSYNNKMNYENFEEWLTTALLPNVSLNFITMMDSVCTTAAGKSLFLLVLDKTEDNGLVIFQGNCLYKETYEVRYMEKRWKI